MTRHMKRRTSLLICMALMGLSVNAYAADVTTTSSNAAASAKTAATSSETHTINVTASRTALKMLLMRLTWCQVLRPSPMVHRALNTAPWIAVSISVALNGGPWFS